MDRRLWGLETDHRDNLVFGGQSLVDLATSYGTPLHVVDEGRLRGNYQRFLSAFQDAYPKVMVYYSYKTNCVPGLIQVLHEEGCGAEVTSPFELWLASRLGVESSRVVYNGVNRNLDDLIAAVQHGVGLINLDSVREASRLMRAAERIGREVRVGIRISPGVGWRAQFGWQPGTDKMIAVSAELSTSSLLDLCCLHVHIGTGLRSTRDYKRAIEVATALIRKLKSSLDVDIAYLDLGGGFGVPTVKTLTLREAALYRVFNVSPAEPRVKDCPSMEVFGRVIGDSLRRCCSRHGVREPVLLLEPGRALTSNAQILLVTIGEIKRRQDGTRFAIADGGMQNTAFPLSYEYHKCFLVGRASAKARERYFVTGPLCSPEDILYRNWKLPELKEGDILAIMDAGAYFTSFANTFSYPRPAVVMVSDGCHRLIRERESFEHMSALDSMCSAMPRGDSRP